MPHYCIHIATSDGSPEGFDLEGFALDRVGAVRALVTETLVEAALEQPRTGAMRTITVIAEDEHGRAVARDAVTIRVLTVPSPDDQALWRAMAAMNRTADAEKGAQPKPGALSVDGC